MKGRELLDRLLDGTLDLEAEVVIPITEPKTARELVEVKEIAMDITKDGNYIPTTDSRPAFGQTRVLAFVPEPQGKKVSK